MNLRIVYILLFIPLIALSSERNFYIELDIGNNATTFKSNLTNTKRKEDNFLQEIKLGYYFNNNHRMYLSSKQIDMDGGVDSEMYSLGYDYIFTTQGKIKPFIGVLFGWEEYRGLKNPKGLQNPQGADNDFQGWGYGAQVGISYDISKTISADLGYKYIRSDASFTLSDVLTVKSVETFFVGLRYKFY